VGVSTLRDICFDCSDPARMAAFWGSVLGYRVHGPSSENEAAAIVAPAGGMRIWFNPVPEPKVAKNRVHIDINMPDQAEMDRLLSLGATALEDIRDDDGTLFWTIMADPEGNEFCAFPAKS